MKSLVIYLSEFCNRLRFREAFIKPRSFVADVLLFDFMAVPTTFFLGKFKWITPNIVTVVAIVVSLTGVFFYWPGEHQNFIIGGLILIVGNVLDGVDGKIARLNKVQSEFGAKLDNHLDKVRKVAALGVLTYDSSFNAYLIVGLIVIHYLLQYVPLERPESLDRIYDTNGIKSLFEPLDALIVLIIIGPMLGSFFGSLCVTILLQIFKILLYKYIWRYD